MKFILKRTSNWEKTDRHFLDKDEPFYDKETIDERTYGKDNSYHLHFIEIKSLEELTKFISSLECKRIVMFKGSWLLGKKPYTIEIYDDYRE